MAICIMTLAASWAFLMGARAIDRSLVEDEMNRLSTVAIVTVVFLITDAESGFIVTNTGPSSTQSSSTTVNR